MTRIEKYDNLITKYNDGNIDRQITDIRVFMAIRIHP